MLLIWQRKGIIMERKYLEVKTDELTSIYELVDRLQTLIDNNPNKSLQVNVIVNYRCEINNDCSINSVRMNDVGCSKI